MTGKPQKSSATDKQKLAHGNELSQKNLLGLISVIPPCGTLL